MIRKIAEEIAKTADDLDKLGYKEAANTMDEILKGIVAEFKNNTKDDGKKAESK